MTLSRYRTIVVDPPWHTHRPPRWAGKKGVDSRGVGPNQPMPYPMMTTDEIAALPVQGVAAPDAHLYLWTINAHMEDAYTVARAWGFRPGQLLTWAKTPRGLGPGGAYASTAEFILFCRRGSLVPATRMDTTWWNWKRPEDGTGPRHSRKPAAFLDIVEQVSPGPYLELFARRSRPGWDCWGNEAPNPIEWAA